MVCVEEIPFAIVEIYVFNKIVAWFTAVSLEQGNSVTNKTLKSEAMFFMFKF